MRELSLYEMNLLCRLMAEDIVDIFEEEEPADFEFSFNNVKFNLYISKYKLRKLGLIEPPEKPANLFFNMNDWHKLNPNIITIDYILDLVKNKESAQVIKDKDQMLELIEFSVKSELIFFTAWRDRVWGDDWRIMILLNDVFGYACSDLEDIEFSDIPELINLYDDYKASGVFAYASMKRNWTMPIKPRITEKFLIAVEKLKKEYVHE
jgi:hypothetical protein